MSGMDTLTEREVEALRVIGTGKPMRLVAETLGVSPRGAKYFSDQLRRKLGVKTSRELIAASHAYFTTETKGRAA